MNKLRLNEAKNIIQNLKGEVEIQSRHIEKLQGLLKTQQEMTTKLLEEKIELLEDLVKLQNEKDLKA